MERQTLIFTEPHKWKSKDMDMERESVRKIAINHRARILGYIWHQFCCVLKRTNMLLFKNVGATLPAVNLFTGSPPTGLHRVRRAPGLLLWESVSLECLLSLHSHLSPPSFRERGYNSPLPMSAKRWAFYLQLHFKCHPREWRKEVGEEGREESRREGGEEEGRKGVINSKPVLLTLSCEYESPGDFLSRQVLIQGVWDPGWTETCRSAFLARSQEILMLLVQRSHLEYRDPKLNAAVFLLIMNIILK